MNLAKDRLNNFARRTALITLLLIIAFNCFSQEYNIYQQDFLELAEIIQNTHPAPDSVKQNLQKTKNQILKQLEGCDDKYDFRITAQTYIAQLHDGHSRLKWTSGLYRTGYFPVVFTGRDNKLFLRNFYKKIPKKYIGQEIATINQTSPDTILARSRKYFSIDNDVSLMKKMKNLCAPGFLELIGVDAMNDLVIEFKDSSLYPILFKRDLKEKILTCSFDGDNYFEIEKPAFHKQSYHSFAGDNGKLFNYKILKNRSACYLNINECFDKQYLNSDEYALELKPIWLVKIFWNLRGGNFKKFLKRMFRKAYRNNINNLIVDLRYNRGGTSILGYQLLDYITNLDSLKDYQGHVVLSELFKQSYPLYFNDIIQANNIDTTNLELPCSITNKQNITTYLRDKNSPYYQEEPAKKFKGDIYILIGNVTYSSASNIATLFTDNNLATMVGSRMGMNPTQYGEVLQFKLKNTGTKGYISCKEFVRPAGRDVENRIYLDIEMQNSIEDEFYGKDPTFEKLLEIISGN